jgi:hypothetical protein
MRTFSPHLRRWAAWGVTLVFTLLAPAAVRAVTLLGLTDSNRLVLFDSTEPEKVVGALEVTGLQQGEQLLGVDIRPTTGQLYAVGSTSRLYVINTLTGAARQVGTGAFAPALNVSAAGGFEIGVTFDPSQDRIRVVSNGQSLRLDPDSATVVALDGPLVNASPGSDFGRVPAVTGVAQDSATLYGIDWKTNRLVTIGSRGGQPVSPDTGQVFGVGPLFVTAGGFADSSVRLNDKVGFDIAGPGVAYASLTRAGADYGGLYFIDLKTGESYEIGPVGTDGGAGFVLRGLAAPPAGSDFYALTASDRLLLFSVYMPGAVLKSVQVTGLQPGEILLALNRGPMDGRIYSVGSSGRFYNIVPATGEATPAPGNPISPPPEGAEFSLARNGLNNQMRLVSDAGQSWLINFNPGPPFVSPTAALRYASDDVNAGRNPRVVGLTWAIMDGPFESTVTRYYGVDAGSDSLVYEQAPDLGTLHTVGPLGFDAGNLGGLENQTNTTFGDSYASLTTPCPGGCASPSTLFKVNMQTGRAAPVGGIGGGESVRDIMTAPPSSLHFGKAAYRVTEDCTSVTLLVIRAGLTANAADVGFATGADGPLPAPAADGRSDYNAASGTLHFAAGETFKPLRILINEDSYPEKGDGHEGEAFTVKLSGVPRDPNRSVFDFTLDGPSTATVLIVDDEDGEAGRGNPVEDPYTFVCQQYHDFLGRDPDDQGFQFWTNNITRCGDDLRCVEAMRVETSAAFFLSIEFQETGFFVDRTYQAAYGRTPVPLTLEEFVRDVRRLNEGVVIGRPGALERLEANKLAFVADFINRREFLERYPFIRPDEAVNFVDSLDANGGGVLSPAERDALIREYTGGGGRKLILRRVVEDEDLKRLAFNRAFVLSQYFGYLRRNPNEAPDTGFEGYDYWLAKLEQFGDFRRAELVKAFISSDEYRRRFGP